MDKQLLKSIKGMAPKPSDRRVQLIRTAGDSSALLRVPVRESHKATAHSAKKKFPCKKKASKRKNEKGNQTHLVAKGV